MSKNPNQKLKLLYLYQILLQRTDENHKLTTDKLRAALERCGITAERKSIYSDIEALQTFGLDVMCQPVLNILSMPKLLIYTLCHLL